MKRTVTIPTTFVCIALGVLIALAGSQGSQYYNGISLFALCASVSYLLHWIIFIPSYIVLSFIGYIFSEGLGDLISNIGYFWSIVALFTAVIRRAHDVGKSGWFMLIPIYNFVLSVSRSQQGPNEWGDPRPHTINKGLESNSEENLTD